MEITPAIIERYAKNRTQLIDQLLQSLGKKVTAAQRDLLDSIVNDLLDRLDKDGDTIKNTIRNKRLIADVETVYQRFAQSSGLEVVKTVAEGVVKISQFNNEYFGLFTTQAELGKINKQVQENLSAWLGISKRGTIQPNGYLDTLLQDSIVRNTVRDMTMKTVISQAGYNEAKAGLRDFIVGNKEKTGALEQYYRNYVYDTYSKVDRASAQIFADQLDMNYAIYEGGIIETSRPFCRKRNGKVFTREEIAEFDPPTAKPPGYDPFTDLGGYGCRHHLNWITKVLAMALRPDLRNAA